MLMLTFRLYSNNSQKTSPINSPYGNSSLLPNLETRLHASKHLASVVQYCTGIAPHFYRTYYRSVIVTWPDGSARVPTFCIKKSHLIACLVSGVLPMLPRLLVLVLAPRRPWLLVKTLAPYPRIVGQLTRYNRAGVPHGNGKAVLYKTIIGICAKLVSCFKHSIVSPTRLHHNTQFNHYRKWTARIPLY